MNDPKDSTNVVMWAEAFVEANPKCGINKSTMVRWFSNAMRAKSLQISREHNLNLELKVDYVQKNTNKISTKRKALRVIMNVWLTILGPIPMAVGGLYGFFSGIPIYGTLGYIVGGLLMLALVTVTTWTLFKRIWMIT